MMIRNKEDKGAQAKVLRQIKKFDQFLLGLHDKLSIIDD